MENMNNLSSNNNEERAEKETDLLVKRTPFHLETGWELVAENKNPSCSHAEIEQLIQKRVINLIDLEIMKVLATYQYLNHYHISFLLTDRLHPAYQKTSYLDNLNKLKRAGIILCYIPITADCMAQGAPYVPASPLRLYCLSQPAFFYMEPLVPDAHKAISSDSLRKMEIAAADQFLIHFLHYYREKEVSVEYLKTVKLGTSLLTIDAMLHYRTVFPGQQEAETVSMPVLAFRERAGWEKYALARLHLLFVWLSRHRNEFLLPFPMAVVENIAMAVTLYACLPDSERSRPLYFCPESLLLLYPPLSSIYRCEEDETGKVKAVRLENID